MLTAAEAAAVRVNLDVSSSFLDLWRLEFADWLRGNQCRTLAVDSAETLNGVSSALTEALMRLLWFGLSTTCQ